MVSSDRVRGNGHKFYLIIRNNSFYSGDGEMLETVDQSGCEVLIFGDIQKLSGHDSEQPTLVDLGLSKHVRLDYLQRFCDSRKATVSLKGKRLSKNSGEKKKQHCTSDEITFKD